MNKILDQQQVILCNNNKRFVKTTLPKLDLENILYYILHNICYNLKNIRHTVQCSRYIRSQQYIINNYMNNINHYVILVLVYLYYYVLL